MIKHHQELIKWFKKEFGVTDYGMLWVSFMEGFIIGGIIIFYILKS